MDGQALLVSLVTRVRLEHQVTQVPVELLAGQEHQVTQA